MGPFLASFSSNMVNIRSIPIDIPTAGVFLPLNIPTKPS